MKQALDIKLLRRRLKYTFSLLRWNGVGRKQNFDNADIAKWCVKLCLDSIKGMR